MSRLSNPLLPALIIFLFAFSFIGALPSLASSLLPNTVNDAPIIGQTTVLYDGALNTGTPDTQNFTYITDPLNPPGVQTFANGITSLDSTADNGTSAGYFDNAPSLVLSRTTGYSIRFNVQVESEAHANNNRAGFSIIALSSDLQGIELGFWQDEIWAQEGGSEPQLFTHAEGAAFDTTTGLLPYELTIQDDMYALSVTDTLILTGTLRDYTAFAGFPDVYETPNFIFLGDDTSSAQARIHLSYVSVITDSTLSNLTATENTGLAINNLGIMDIDANGNDVVSTLSVTSGKLTVTTSAEHGLMASDITGNGTNNVVMTGSVGEINATLALSGGLIYRSDLARQPTSAPAGSDTLTFSLNDNGNTGTGGAQTAQKNMTISITPLAVQLATFEAHPEPDQILIRWQTVSEQDTLGFNLYRSPPSVPPNFGGEEMIQLNSELIPSQAPGSGQGATYEWLDNTVEAGHTYYYWLEDIDTNGNGNPTQHPPVSATANIPSAIIIEDITTSSTQQAPWGLAALGLTFLIAKKLLKIKKMAGE